MLNDPAFDTVDADMDLALLTEAMVAELVRGYPVDPSRVYIGGISAEGDAAWAGGILSAENYAGILPYSAGVQPFDDALWGNLSNTAVAVVHGDADDITPVAPVDDITDELLDRGFDLTYWRLPGEGHGGRFSETFPLAMDWLRQRESRSTCPGTATRWARSRWRRTRSSDWWTAADGATSGACGRGRWACRGRMRASLEDGAGRLARGDSDMLGGMLSLGLMVAAAAVTGGLILGTGVWLAGRQTKQIVSSRSLWGRLAAERDLEFEETDDSHVIKGEVGDRYLRAWTEGGRGSPPSTLVVHAKVSDRAIPPGLEIRRKGARGPRWGSSATEDVDIGDGEFDSAAFLGGEVADLGALLDGDARRVLLPLIHAGELIVHKSQIEVVRQIKAPVEPGARRVLEDVFRAADVLRLEPGSRHERLARNALEDPVAGVRHVCLKLLTNHHPDSPHHRPTLEAALMDPSPAIRLEAGKLLGDESTASHALVLARSLAEDGDAEELAGALSSMTGSGTLDDIAWLRPLTRGAFRPAAVKGAAARAIESIQARLGGGVGELAVLDEEAAGRLSPVATEGALSQAEGGGRGAARELGARAEQAGAEQEE